MIYSALRAFRRQYSRSFIEGDVPQISISTCPECSLNQHNAQLGIAIDETTAYPNWDGQPMDHAMAVDFLFSASGDFKAEHQDVSAEIPEDAERRQADVRQELVFH